uniref:cystathionine gamma-lyase n=1 Tax=Kwoniella dejecticola CBS 10117 TaxID=1296121 RepID=A0A1A6A2H4_9TREE|nr:cystathionine gamma-lyase [Kwoniella dejecticola CBS 10117]OBR84256.1 cystathionine gamma-lyase [Kwoniella dejecticola CBS 10117]
MSRHDHFSTRSIHVGSEPDPSTGAVVPSLSVATTFRQEGVNKPLRGFDYSRSSNPTRSDLESVLTSLETCPSATVANDARHDASGGDSLVFASGSAATAAVAHWITLSKEEGGAGGKDGKGHGGHILAVNDVYGGTARYLSRASGPTGLEVTYLNMEKAGEKGIREAIRPDTKLIWLELPTNPLLLVPPVRLISDIVHSLPSETRPLILVDSTFLSPYYFTPLIPTNGEHPLADITMSSLSKYSSGHSDIILGSLTISPTTNKLRPELLKGLRFLQNAMGASPSPRDCHLMIRSIKTLSVRMIKHGLNALRVASWLSTETDLVEGVRYPGLKTDDAFALEYTRTLGIPFGGMITFAIKDASAEQTERFCTELRIAILAESLGGVESLVEVPYGMTHAHLPQETLKELRITPNLIRLSVGIEDYEDLVEDLEQALETAMGKGEKGNGAANGKT